MVFFSVYQGCKRRGKVTRCHPGPPTASWEPDAMKKTLLLLVWWLLPGRAQGPLSLKDAVRIALEKNQSVAASTATEKRSEEHTSELQSPMYLVCRLLL